MCHHEVYVVALHFFYFLFLNLFLLKLFAEVGGQELEPPAFLPELLDTPERILSKNGLRFT